MKVSKLLYVADTKKREFVPDVVEKILPLRHIGLDEVVFFQVTPSKEKVEELSDASIKSKVLVSNDISAENIVRIAEDENVSLVVMHVEKEENPLFIPLLKKLTEHSSTPVLVMEGIDTTEDRGKNLFDHSIFATDWSLPSERAFRYLLEFKALMKEVEIIHVIHEKLTIRDIRDLKEKIAQTRKTCLDEGIDAESHIYAGETSEEIVRASQDYRGTIIVLGTGEKKSFWSELFKKDATLQVVKRATVPVLLVP